MSFPAFLARLFENSGVQVPQFAPLSSGETEEARQVLVECERQYRLSLAGSPPDFDANIACQAAETLYRICQCLVYRELVPKDVLPAATPVSSPAGDAMAHYSADLTLRFLPDIWRLTKAASELDPLMACLKELAGRWPLSSVGIPGISTCSIDGFAGDRALLALYVDRIIERRDKSRLGDRRVRQMLRSAVGAHTDLAPELAAAIAEME
jgi:hypothetical protein